MEGVLAERAVNEIAERSNTSVAQSCSPPELGDAVFKTPKARPPKAHRLCQSTPALRQPQGWQQSPEPASSGQHLEQGLFKVPKEPWTESLSTPVRVHSTSSLEQMRETSEQIPEKGTLSEQQDFVFKTPKAPAREVSLTHQSTCSTPVTERKEKLAFPDTPSPIPGHLALPSPLTTTNGVSQRVLPAIGAGLEQTSEEEVVECCICHDRDGGKDSFSFSLYFPCVLLGLPWVLSPDLPFEFHHVTSHWHSVI
jgi:hypothetical protein